MGRHMLKRSPILLKDTLIELFNEYKEVSHASSPNIGTSCAILLILVDKIMLLGVLQV